MLRNGGFLEFPCLGNTWSWRGVRQNEIIRCKLDKAFGNEEWHSLFPKTKTNYLQMIGSDHRPILTQMQVDDNRRSPGFYFDKRWLGKPDFAKTVELGWTRYASLRGNRITDKISNCRREISRWRKRQFLPGKVKIEKLKTKLEAMKNSDVCSTTEIKGVTHELYLAYAEEETYWKQKSRNKWLREGDNNTKFFHAQTKQRRAKNRIIGLFNEAGVWVEKEDDIEAEAVRYFNSLFTSNGTVLQADSLDGIEAKVSDADNTMLLAKATTEEVRKALFTMDPGKAPGPDGMTALFFQSSWPVIKDDVTRVVNAFISTGAFEKSLNITNICLIPKTAKPTTMAEFRPISLCNVIYKIISKVVCLRLTKILPKLVSDTQSAFVKGRLISDNILIAQEMFHALRTNKKVKGGFMAIKTDMSKAYDRIEWSFLGSLLQKLGFHSTWVKGIMHCVSSVGYSVLINGNPKGRITPKRGLRQGDPLSPYLFILCTEALIGKLRLAESRSQLTGISVARTCPSVSHLLFADDSLFFCKATKAESETILRILTEYEGISGQQINFTKSSIQFGKDIDPVNRHAIQGCLGISTLGGMGNYLGLPEGLEGAKTKVFAFVSEKINTRINSWSAKFLSKGGKEVLIKSVLTAIPSYVMSCYRLPKTTVSKISAAIAQFWWQNSGTNRGIHWAKWDKLCRTKPEGGLGFRAIEEFNSALLAKQLWRLLDYPNSLLSRILQARYFAGSNPLIPKRTYSPSYGWKSIISARALVMKGLIKRVGSGESIHVWRDPWIPDQFPRPARGYASHLYPDLRVSELIDTRARSWRIPLINQLFEPGDAQLILGIHIPSFPRPDRFGWHFNKSGFYTVKSGYWAERTLSNNRPRLMGPHIHDLQVQVWNIKAPQKLKHFIWQSISGHSAVKSNLSKRGFSGDQSCDRCGADIETINHVLFECPPAVQAWAISNIPASQSFPGQSILSNIDFLISRLPRTERFISYPWILWYLWKARNDKVFANIDRDPREIIQLADSEATLWANAQKEKLISLTFFSDVPASFSELTFRPLVMDPAFTGYKCMVDASWKASDPFSGIGWSCFTFAPGNVQMGSQRIRRSLSALHSEFEGLLWAMSCLQHRQILDVLFLVDCAELLSMIEDPTAWPAFSPYLEDFHHLQGSFRSCSVSKIPRVLNHKADFLARSARVFPGFQALT